MWNSNLSAYVALILSSSAIREDLVGGIWQKEENYGVLTEDLILSQSINCLEKTYSPILKLGCVSVIYDTSTVEPP